MKEFHALLRLDREKAVSKGVEPRDIDIPEEVTEYIGQITSFIRESEGQHLPEYGYMKKQADINEKMRAILIDWLIEVHYKFKLNADTLFITINIIDRYLSVKQVKRQVL